MSNLPLGIWKSSKSKLVALFVSLLCFFVWSGTSLGEADSTLADDEPLLEKIGPSISLRSAYWRRDKSFSNTKDFLATSAWLSLRPKEILGAKLFFDGYVGKNDSMRSSSILSEVREGYVERSFGDIDLRVGRQIVVWGRADKINPTDQWSVRNLTFLATDDEDQRLGAFAVNFAFNFGDYRFVGIFQPEWRSPIYPIPPIPGITLINLEPSSPYKQFGLKLDHTGGALDASLSFSNVISRIPNLNVLSSGAQGTSIGLNYEFVQVIGGDFALNLGDYGIRGELAYTDSADESGLDPSKFNSELFTVLGVDRTFIESFNLNCQLLYKHVFNFQDPNLISDSNQKLLASQENLIANQIRSDLFGLSIRPSYKMLNDTLEVEVAYVQWFYESGGLLRPKATYAINDHLKIIAGAEEYFGSTNSFFGRLSGLSSVFTELRANF